jgi:hypothetical protein
VKPALFQIRPARARGYIRIAALHVVARRLRPRTIVRSPERGSASSVGRETPVKSLLFIAAIGFGVYYGYNHFRNPAHIDNPVFAELRVDVHADSRTINVLTFAKMADEADCRERAEIVWRKVIDCKECTMQLIDCKPSLSARYEQLFDDVPINISYLSLTRGSRYERDARMVIWGITGKEGVQLCELLKNGIRPRYSGRLQCVGAR